MSAALIIAAETSKTIFYIFAGMFAAWAIVLSALGLAREGFPGESGGRGVMALSALLALGAVVTAVATASTPENVGKQELKPITAVQAQHEWPTGTSAPAPAKEQGGGGGGAPSGTVQVTAAQGLAFEQKSLSAKAGKVTVDFDNPTPIPHNVHLEGGGKELGGTKTISSSKATASLDLKAGTYTFYCSVPGHRQAGMEGELTVK